MLTFDNVRFQYAVEDFSIIDHLSFEVQDGEFVSIIGASGCGKSTIFRLVPIRVRSLPACCRAWNRAGIRIPWQPVCNFRSMFVVTFMQR